MSIVEAPTRTPAVRYWRLFSYLLRQTPVTKSANENKGDSNTYLQSARIENLQLFPCMGRCPRQGGLWTRPASPEQDIDGDWQSELEIESEI